MEAMRVAAAAVALVVGGGCVELASYGYTATTRDVAAARAPDCAFDLLTARPGRPFVELGVLERPSAEAREGSGLLPRTAGDFRRIVSPEVCRAGGDAVLTEVNGFGDYVRGTVIKYKDQSGEASAEAPPAVVPAAEPPLPPAPAGSTPATVTAQSTEVRSAPFKVAPVVSVLSLGQRLFVKTTATDGWRAAKLLDGRSGYVQDAEIKVIPSAR